MSERTERALGWRCLVERRTHLDSTLQLQRLPSEEAPPKRLRMKRSKPHTSLPKQDPAAYVRTYVPGTPTLGQYQPKSAPRCRPTPLTRTEASAVFGRELIKGSPPSPVSCGRPGAAGAVTLLRCSPAAAPGLLCRGLLLRRSGLLRRHRLRSSSSASGVKTLEPNDIFGNAFAAPHRSGTRTQLATKGSDKLP